MEVVPQENRPARKVYHITEAGRKELRRWLTAPLPLKGSRHASLIQVFFAGQLSDEEILTMFKREAEPLRTTLEYSDEIRQNSAPFIPSVALCLTHR